LSLKNHLKQFKQHVSGLKTNQDKASIQRYISCILFICRVFKQ